MAPAATASTIRHENPCSTVDGIAVRLQSSHDRTGRSTAQRTAQYRYDKLVYMRSHAAVGTVPSLVRHFYTNTKTTKFTLEKPKHFTYVFMHQNVAPFLLFSARFRLIVQYRSTQWENVRTYTPYTQAPQTRVPLECEI